MIKIFKRQNCAYCPMVMKYLDKKGVAYTVHEAEGEEYKRLANEWGVNVPLVWNGERAMVGYNIAKLNELIA